MGSGSYLHFVTPYSHNKCTVAGTSWQETEGFHNLLQTSLKHLYVKPLWKFEGDSSKFIRQVSLKPGISYTGVDGLLPVPVALAVALLVEWPG